MLKIENLHAYYGKSHVLHGVSFGVEPGEIVALLGRNGSGRSTTAKAIMGLVDWEGHIAWKGQSLTGKKAYEIAHLGIGYVLTDDGHGQTMREEQMVAGGQGVPREHRLPAGQAVDGHHLRAGGLRGVPRNGLRRPNRHL